MQIKPIITALKFHLAGTILIVLQIALTLAIVCNAMFIIQQRVAHLSRPSGIDEANILVVQNQWIGKPITAQSAALMAADLQTLRHLSGVAGIFATNSYPLDSGGWSMGVRYGVDQKNPTTPTAIYFADDQALPTLGLKLLAGRNFRADEIGNQAGRATLAPRVVIITKALADKLFPGRSAVGRTMCIGNAGPSTIVGVVERLQASGGGLFSEWAERSTLVPYRLLAANTTYIMRAQPGQLTRLSRAVPQALIAANPMRVIDPKVGVQTFEEIRADAYKSDRGMAILMGLLCVMLLAITAAGIVGLTSFWVAQRRRQIGMRRALGATRGDILSYFLTENLLISLGGVIIGTLLAIGMNLCMATQFEIAQLSLNYLAIGTAALLLLGQTAVLVPALRASRVSPAEATRYQ